MRSKDRYYFQCSPTIRSNLDVKASTPENLLHLLATQLLSQGHDEHVCVEASDVVMLCPARSRSHRVIIGPQ